MVFPKAVTAIGLIHSETMNNQALGLGFPAHSKQDVRKPGKSAIFDVTTGLYHIKMLYLKMLFL